MAENEIKKILLKKKMFGIVKNAVCCAYFTVFCDKIVKCDVMSIILCNFAVEN